jgi:hypothetical protein
MIWRADCRHDLYPVESQLSVLVEDVLPAFVIEDHGAPVRVDRFGKGAQGLSASWAGASTSGIGSLVARMRRGYTGAGLAQSRFFTRHGMHARVPPRTARCGPEWAALGSSEAQTPWTELAANNGRSLKAA